MNKNAKNKMAPEFRFPEFRESGEWISCVLKNVFTIFQGFAFSSNDSASDGLRWLKIADVSIQKMNHDTPSFLPIEYKEKYKNFLVRKGDYVVALTRPILNKELKIAKVDEVLHESLLNQRVGKLITTKNIDFVYYLLQTASLISSIEKNIGGNDPPNLSTQQIEEIKTYVPSTKEEQQKIADCLSSLDELITAQSQKIEALKAHKKGLMQQLFPAEGETVPKLRFAEFKDSGEWEEDALDNVAIFIKGKGISKSDISITGNLPCIRYGELYTHYTEIINSAISFTNLASDELVLSEANDVIIPSSGETKEDIATASCVLKNGIALGGDLNIIRSEINGIFLSYYLSHEKKSSIAKLAQGDAVVHLYISQLKKLIINFPESKTEQYKIADCLSSLDELITAQKEKIEALKMHKKGLMQGLFPQINESN